MSDSQADKLPALYGVEVWAKYRWVELGTQVYEVVRPAYQAYTPVGMCESSRSVGVLDGLVYTGQRP